MKKILFWALITVCIASSGATAASKPRMDVMPIQIIVEKTDNTGVENELVNELVKQFETSTKYRLTTSSNITCLQLRLSSVVYRPAAHSFKGGAMADFVCTLSTVWTAKPKDKYPYYVYNKITVFDNTQLTAINIVQLTDQVVDMIHRYFHGILD